MTENYSHLNAEYKYFISIVFGIFNYSIKNKLIESYSYLDGKCEY